MFVSDQSLRRQHSTREIGIDGRVLWIHRPVPLMTAILFGLVPAIKASRVDLQGMLKEGGRSSLGSKHRARAALVVADVALSLVLLIGAGLLIRSFARLQNVSPGFQAQGLLTMQMSVPAFKYREPYQVKSFYDNAIKSGHCRLLNRLARFDLHAKRRSTPAVSSRRPDSPAWRGRAARRFERLRLITSRR